jgi:hypothetical protein
VVSIAELLVLLLIVGIAMAAVALLVIGVVVENRRR